MFDYWPCSWSFFQRGFKISGGNKHIGFDDRCQEAKYTHESQVIDMSFKTIFLCHSSDEVKFLKKQQAAHRPFLKRLFYEKMAVNRST